MPASGAGMWTRRELKPELHEPIAARSRRHGGPLSGAATRSGCRRQCRVIWSAISRARDAHRLGRPGTWAAQVCPGPSALSAAQTRSRVAAPWSCRVRRSHRGALAIIATCPQRRGPAGDHLARCHWQAAGSDLARSGAAVARPGPGPDWRTGICFGT